nr:MAG TPA: hypothetical protein [Caudoviricetes sp.]
MRVKIVKRVEALSVYLCFGLGRHRFWCLSKKKWCQKWCQRKSLNDAGLRSKKGFLTPLFGIFCDFSSKYKRYIFL